MLTFLCSSLIHRFSPVNFALKVVDKPLKNINFQQKTAELAGSVECVDGNVCGEINVVLRGLEPLKEEYHGTTKGNAAFCSRKSKFGFFHLKSVSSS